MILPASGSSLWRRTMTLHLTPSTLRAAALVSLLGWAGPGAANDSAAGYPSKPVKLIVASTAGSSPDVVTRLVAEQLSAPLGQAVLVDNRPGAGQTIAVKALAASEPDGHTLLLGTTGGLAINPALYRHLDLSVSKSFVPVALMVTIPNVLAVASTVPANTLGELVAYAKANPGKLSFGASQGTPLRLLGEYVRAKSGMDTVYVPYKGGSQALPDLLAGRIQIGADGTVAAAAAHPRGQGPRVGGDQHDAPARDPRRAHIGRGRHRRLPAANLYGVGCARRHAARDRQQAQCGGQRRAAVGNATGEPGEAR